MPSVAIRAALQQFVKSRVQNSIRHVGPPIRGKFQGGTFSLLPFPREGNDQLGQFGDFLVEMIEGGFERFVVVRIGGVCQIVGDADARELKVFYGLFAVVLFGAPFDLCRLAALRGSAAAT